MRWLDGIMTHDGREFEKTLGDSEGQGSCPMLQSMGLQRA